ncbi:MAG TPA: tetratricopeptide repeat protein, partial [Candidatus Polarisedimenticolia bacterium]|nr:tetratricopeptide repeat protein [Candidatus Polarisedimenticolia bacterium]
MSPAHRPARDTSLYLLLLSVLILVACEKETHRASRREYQEIMARALPAAEQAKALESFVERYPEPKTNSNLARACRTLAEYHARADHPDIAASWYERALRADPDDPDLLNALGYHYARNGLNLDRAVSVLETATRLAEERRYSARRQGLIKDSLGWAYRARGDLPLAVAFLEEACRLAPGVPIVREHLADTYRAIGERDKAVAIYLDLYLQGRATDTRLRGVLGEIGREGGAV